MIKKNLILNSVCTIYIVFIALHLHGCNTNNKDNFSPVSVKSVEDTTITKRIEDYVGHLNGIQMRDTLKISVTFTDCGEWGGHKEFVRIQRGQNQKLFAQIIVDSVVCEIIAADDYQPELKSGRFTVIDNTVPLDSTDEKSISVFLQRMTELTLKGVMAGANAGAHYNVQNTNSTFELKFWNNGDLADTGYGNIRKRIMNKIQAASRQ